ncbi:nicotinate-nucleotide adenylyltransferase [soil metagenome]
MGLAPPEVRWGILGGTFDPIHYGHLTIAEQAREVLGLAGVLFMPAGVPPHKQGHVITPAAARTAMVELAIEDNGAFRLSRAEVDRTGPSYLVETLERLVRGESDAPSASEYVFLMSAEALLGLRTWRSPERILKLCRLAVVPRPGHRTAGRAWLEENFPGSQDRVRFLDGPELCHSSSEVRRLAADGRSVRYLVPPRVEAYIRERELYGPTLWNKN